MKFILIRKIIKEHINHGKLEYSEADLESSHANYDEYHKGEEVDKNDATY